MCAISSLFMLTIVIYFCSIVPTFSRQNISVWHLRRKKFELNQRRIELNRATVRLFLSRALVLILFSLSLRSLWIESQYVIKITTKSLVPNMSATLYWICLVFVKTKHNAKYISTEWIDYVPFCFSINYIYFDFGFLLKIIFILLKALSYP